MPGSPWIDHLLQPRFLPSVVLGAFALFSGLYLMQSWLARKDPDHLDTSLLPAGELAHWLRPLELALYFVVYAASIPARRGGRSPSPTALRSAAGCSRWCACWRCLPISHASRRRSTSSTARCPGRSSRSSWRASSRTRQPLSANTGRERRGPSPAPHRGGPEPLHDPDRRSRTAGLDAGIRGRRHARCTGIGPDPRGCFGDRVESDRSVRYQ